MNKFFEELKNAWNKADNALIQLIYVNIAVFVFLALIIFPLGWFGFTWPGEFLYRQFELPPTLGEFITRPWTLVTYAFAHSMKDIMHIVFNMLWLYWFGKLVVEYVGNKKLVSLYILGGIAGGIIYLIFYNFVGKFASEAATVTGMVGASAAVNAIVIGAATLLPKHSIHLIFLGPVNIKYIAGFSVLASLIGTSGSNAGGNLAHLGGALIGYIYITQLKKGNDLGAWIHRIGDFIRSFFVKPDPIKVSHRKAKTRSKASSPQGVTVAEQQGLPNQEEIDAILDKIAASGYESLTKAEKQKLFDASKK